jgi:epoxyqueuosine reductase
MISADLVNSARSNKVKQLAFSLGLKHCAISEAAFLEEEAPRLEKWLQEGKQGQMKWMENHFDKRLDPRKLFPGAKSVISILYNYFPEQEQNTSSESLKVSRYAYGEDYHFVLKDKMNQLLQAIREEFGDVTGRAFVDSAPVMDKAWAQRSGLGWIGKHSNLLNRTMGSFFFIGEIITDLVLEPDTSGKDYCGTCTRCIDACPTSAIPEPYVVDGSRCISYFTIELKEAIPEEFRGRMNNWLFGCDICQEVCPWNRFSRPTEEVRFKPTAEFLTWTAADWQSLSEDAFYDIFGKSPLMRPGITRIKRNIEFLASFDSTRSRGK